MTTTKNNNLFLWYGRWWRFFRKWRRWCWRTDNVFTTQRSIHFKRLVISEELRRQSSLTHHLGTDCPSCRRLISCKQFYSHLYYRRPILKLSWCQHILLNKLPVLRLTGEIWGKFKEFFTNILSALNTHPAYSSGIFLDWTVNLN